MSEKLPYELNLEILLKLDNFKDLKKLCSTSKYLNKVCKREKSKIIANIFFNKYGENAFGEDAVLDKLDDLKMINVLIKLNADIHVKNNIPLLYSAESGNFEAVKLLVKNGADIHVENDLPLIISAQNGHLKIVHFLIQNGANIHTTDDLPLIKAAAHGHLEIVKYLEKNGVDIHSGNDTALIGATLNNHLNVVKYLVKNGANRLNEALGLAEKNGHANIFYYLKKKIMSIN